MNYEFGAPKPKGISPQVAAAEVNRIIARDGGATPSVVVDESRPEDAPLHPAFEWDDSVAAEQYRIGQARHIIRCVLIAPDPAREAAPTIRAYVSVPTPAEDNPNARLYKRTLDVLGGDNEIERAAVKRRFLNEIQALRRRYKDLLEIEAELRKHIEALAQ